MYIFLTWLELQKRMHGERQTQRLTPGRRSFTSSSAGGLWPLFLHLVFLCYGIPKGSPTAPVRRRKWPAVTPPGPMRFHEASDRHPAISAAP